MALKDIVFGLRLNDGQFKTGMNNARKNVKSLGKDVSQFSKDMVKYGKIAGAALGGGIGAALTIGVKSAFEGAQIDAQLKNSLGKIGSGGSFDFLNDLSSKIMKAFVFDDEEVRQGFTTLINAGMKVDQVNRSAALVADVARAKQISYGQAADIVAKAFNGQLKALKSVGIYMTSTKDRAKDAALAMDALNQKFGGAAAAAAQVMSPLESMKLAIDDSLQAVGEQLLPVITPMIEQLSAAFVEFAESGKLQGMVNGVLSALQTAKEFVGYIGSSMGKIWESFSDGGFKSWLGTLWETILENGKALIIAMGQHIWNGVTNGVPKLAGVVLTALIEKMQEVLGPKVSKMLGLDEIKGVAQEMGNDQTFNNRAAEIDAAFNARRETVVGKLAKETSERFSGDVPLSTPFGGQKTTSAPAPPPRPLSRQEQGSVNSANAAIENMNAMYARMGAKTKIQLITNNPMSAVAAH